MTTRINLPFQNTLLIVILLITLFSVSFSVKAQVVWQDPNSEVYNFLTNQANKGNIDFRDLVLPISRKSIAEHLQSLDDSSLNLSAVEQSDLKFYLREFAEFNPSNNDTLRILKKDQAGRFRVLSVKEDDFILNGDPVLNLSISTGQNSTVTKQGGGLSFWGHATKNLTFQGYFEDITESGDGIDRVRGFTAEEGIVRTVTLNQNSINYSRFKGNITYNWSKGTISLGQDQMQWGYGENGRLVLSDKAPSYPMIRLDFKPLKWLQFDYMHAWLHSDMVDSTRTYPKGNNVYGDNRELYIQKFIATHSLTFFPLKGLSVSLGESMVYSDRLNAAYLIPIMFFKAFDQYESKYNVPRGSNGQFFLQASSRNHIKRAHVYTTLFIDEIRMSEIFNRAKSRNQVGFNIGASITDLFVPYMNMGIEYTRINPFVYQNLLPAQNYTHQNYSLGDWIGQNADRITAWLKYNPAPRLSTRVQLDFIRKGVDGTLEDQYFAEPQPGFLAGTWDTQKQLMLEAKYQIMNQFAVRASFYKQGGIIRPDLQGPAISERFTFGLSYQLY